MSPFDVIGLIRGRKEKRAAGIEEVARRLAGGEVVSPEEIEAILDHTGTDEQALQERIDALVRRAELRQLVAAGEAAQKRLDLIDAEIDTAWQAAVAADEVQRRVRQKHEAERIALGQTIRNGDTAADELLSPANLSPADRERLAEAQRAVTTAAEGLGDVNRRMPELQDSLARGEAALAEALERRPQSSPDAQRQTGEARNAVKARTARLRAAEAELPGLRQTAEEAERVLSQLMAELRAS